MFKCLDCGKTFDIKPEFCSCGGNSFEAEMTQIPQTKNSSSVRRSALPPQQIISVLIFVLCLILAIVPWLIKVADKAPIEKSQPVEMNTSVVPDIDTFWDNKPVKVEQKTTPIETVKSVTKSAAKNVVKATAKGANTVQKKVVTPAKETVKKAVDTVKKTPEKIEQKQGSKPTSQSVTEKTVTSKPIETQEVQTKPQVDPKVMYEYKKNLNIALASHMNFLAINGNGKCAVQFSIDKDGRLVNRAFVYKSDNVSVNNEVYNMLMRMPRFTPPPAGYNGEKFKISFEMKNGDYKFAYFE